MIATVYLRDGHRLTFTDDERERDGFSEQVKEGMATAYLSFVTNGRTTIIPTASVLYVQVDDSDRAAALAAAGKP